MRRLIFLLAIVTANAAERDGNRITIGNDIAIEFASPVSFQYEHWSGPKPVRGAPLCLDSLTLTLKDTPDGGVQFSSRFLELTYANGQLIVRTTSGREVAAMRAGLRFKTYPDEMFYGLGATNAAKLNLRGSVIASIKPFMLSSHG